MKTDQKKEKPNQKNENSLQLYFLHVLKSSLT